MPECFVARALRFLLLLGLAGMLAGCAGLARSVHVTADFDTDRAALINEHGSAVIRGQAFVRIKGKAQRSVGGDVFLIPRTDYADEYFLQVFGGNKSRFGLPKVENADLRFREFTRKVIADTGGRFAFDGVPQGKYYILAEIPSVLGHEGWSYWVMEQVTVSGKRSVRVIMRGY